MPTSVVLCPADRLQLAAYIYELMRPHQDALPVLLDETIRWKLLANAASIAWNLSRLERRPEAAGLARRSYADIAGSAPALMWLVDDMLHRARKMAEDDWYSVVTATAHVENDTLTITIELKDDGFSDVSVAGTVEN